MSAALAHPFVFTMPCVIDGMPDDTYHADPVPGGSLSSTGARRLLPPSTPAAFKWEREHGRPEKAVFDFGHAAHQMVLGAGAELAVIDAEDWRTKAAQEAKKAAYARGAVPLLQRDHETVTAMAGALREHPTAAALFSAGKPEQSLFWIDEPTGLWLRARLDWLPDPIGGRLIVADYKTAPSANPAAFAKSAANYGFHQQDAFYTDGIIALGLDPAPAFVFVTQEKTPPYLVSVVELDPLAKRIGRFLNRAAINVYAECLRTGEWPGYGTDVAQVPLPSWYTRSFEGEL